MTDKLQRYSRVCNPGSLRRLRHLGVTLALAACGGSTGPSSPFAGEWTFSAPHVASARTGASESMTGTLIFNGSSGALSGEKRSVVVTTNGFPIFAADGPLYNLIVRHDSISFRLGTEYPRFSGALDGMLLHGTVVAVYGIDTLRGTWDALRR